MALRIVLSILLCLTSLTVHPMQAIASSALPSTCSSHKNAHMKNASESTHVASCCAGSTEGLQETNDCQCGDDCRCFEHDDRSIPGVPDPAIPNPEADARLSMRGTQRVQARILLNGAANAISPRDITQDRGPLRSGRHRLQLDSVLQV